MPSQSELAVSGLRLGVLGTAAGLALAAPRFNGDLDPVAPHVDATRTGMYFSRGVGSEWMGMVVNGQESLRALPSGVRVFGQLTLDVQAINTVFAGPSAGAPASPTFRTLVASDIPSLSATYALTGPIVTSGLTQVSDRLLGRTTAGTGAIEEITVGTGLSFAGGVLSAAAGTVTSIDVAVPSYMGSAGGPITTAGTITLSFNAQADNLVFAGPAGGGPASPSFRALEASDIPDLSTTYALAGPVSTSGLTQSTARLLGRTTAGTGAVEEITVGSGLAFAGGVLSSTDVGGTVTSVDVAVPSYMSSAGGPITGAGTITLDFDAQADNLVFAGPSAGGPLAPSFRLLVASDMPDLSGIYQPLDADLTAISALATTGLAARTGAGTWTTRTIVGTANEISVANGGGVAGDPAISLPAAITLTGKTITGGTFTGLALTVLDNQFTIQDNVDPTKQAQFQLSGLSAATLRTYTLPDADIIVAGINITQTWPAAQNFATAGNTMGGGAYSADDSILLLRRDSTAVPDSHAVRDESTWTVAAGGGGYSSFDAVAEYVGASAYNHLHAFQSRPSFAGSGSLVDLVGFWSQEDHSGAATVTNRRGVWVKNPTGAGVITVNYGLHVEDQTRGATNYAIYTGAGQVRFGGAVTVAGASITQTGAFGISTGTGTSTFNGVATHANKISVTWSSSNSNYRTGAGWIWDTAGDGSGTINGGIFSQSNTLYLFGGPSISTSQVLISATGLTVGGTLTVASDTDVTTILGRARIDSRTTDALYISHFDQSGTAEYALYHSAVGRLQLNATSGQSIGFYTGDINRATLSASAFTLASGINFVQSGASTFTSGTGAFAINGTATNAVSTNGIHTFLVRNTSAGASAFTQVVARNDSTRSTYIGVVGTGASGLGGANTSYVGSNGDMYFLAGDSVRAFLSNTALTLSSGINFAMSGAATFTSGTGLSTFGGLLYANGGEVRLTQSTTDAAVKVGALTMAHYTNAEENVAVLYSLSLSGSNTINIGGGTGSYNAASNIVFYTAVNGTTVTGTPTATIDSSGLTLAGGYGFAMSGAATATFGSGTTTIPNVDINSGAIDGTAIGAAAASTGTFTTLMSQESVIVDTPLGSAAIYRWRSDGARRYEMHRSGTSEDWDWFALSGAAGAESAARIGGYTRAASAWDFTSTTSLATTSGHVAVGQTATLPSLGILRVGGADPDFLVIQRFQNAENAVSAYWNIGGSASGSVAAWQDNAVLETSKVVGASHLIFSAFSGSHIWHTGAGRAQRMQLSDAALTLASGINFIQSGASTFTSGTGAATFGGTLTVNGAGASVIEGAYNAGLRIENASGITGATFRRGDQTYGWSIHGNDTALGDFGIYRQQAGARFAAMYFSSAGAATFGSDISVVGLTTLNSDGAASANTSHLAIRTDITAAALPQHLVLLIPSTGTTSGMGWGVDNGSGANAGGVAGIAATRVSGTAFPNVVGRLGFVVQNSGSSVTALTVDPTLVTLSVPLTVASNTDVTTILGRTRVDARITDYLILSHFDQTAVGSYALAQGPSGDTYLNSASGQALRLRVNNSDRLIITSTATVPTATDVTVGGGSLRAGTSLLVGALAAQTYELAGGSWSPANAIAGTATGSSLAIGAWGANALGSVLTFSKSRNATLGSHTAVNTSDVLGTISFNGSDSLDYREGAAIRVLAADNASPPAGVVADILLLTSPGGASAVVERLRVSSQGNVVVGNASLATTATAGFLYIPSCAGTPTGTPTTYTDRLPLIIDRTNNKLYFYSGGAWRDAGP